MAIILIALAGAALVVLALAVVLAVRSQRRRQARRRAKEQMPTVIEPADAHESNIDAITLAPRTFRQIGLVFFCVCVFHAFALLAYVAPCAPQAPLTPGRTSRQSSTLVWLVC